MGFFNKVVEKAKEAVDDVSSPIGAYIGFTTGGSFSQIFGSRQSFRHQQKQKQKGLKGKIDREAFWRNQKIKRAETEQKNTSLARSARLAAQARRGKTPEADALGADDKVKRAVKNKLGGL
jgi:hypothetical protein